MKKNVLFWIGVKSESKLMLEKHGNFDYLNILFVNVIHTFVN